MSRQAGLACPDGMHDAGAEAQSLALADYQSLAGFRFHVRRFFAFSEAAIEAAGLSPTQYQALLAIKADAGSAPITMTELADRLFIRLNSAVELVGRMEAAGLVHRHRADVDRRRIEIELTARGEALLEPLARQHLKQHREHLPELMRLLTMMA